jgi:hypothetical protein
MLMMVVMSRRRHTPPRRVLVFIVSASLVHKTGKLMGKPRMDAECTPGFWKTFVAD